MMNKATKLVLTCLLMIFGISATSMAQVTKIRDARGMDGQEVTIVGIMNTPDYGFNDGQFFVQDTTGGINVFYDDVGGANNQDSSAFLGWTKGDTLQITGTIGSFGQQVQIAPSSVTILGTGDASSVPVTSITQADLSVDSKHQGMLVKIESVGLADGETWPADAQTSSGVSLDVATADSAFILRIDRDESYYDGAPAPTEAFNLTGVLARFNSDVQVMPFDSTDVQNIVKVTFMVNTATAPDTVMGDHYVGVFGAISGPNGAGNPYLGQTVDWNNSTDIVADNKGGDYWSVTFDMAAGDTYTYKYWLGSDKDTELAGGGWESGDNREFTLDFDQASDSVAPLNWYETRMAPFTSEEDSVSLYFRVNVGAQAQDGSFDPETFKVGVRGNGAFFTNDWGTGDFLEKGGQTGDNLFYEGVVRAQKDSAAAIDGSIEYKFVLEAADGTVTWESTDNRPVNIPAQDSTVQWVFFNNIPPTDAVIVNTTLSFEVNVGILEGLDLFNSSIDTVSVRGTFNSWGEARMNFNQVLGTYEANNLPYTKAEGTEEKYKYYIKWDARRDSAESEFFLEGIQSANTGWEEPGVTGGADRSFTIENKANQDKLSEFYNGVEPEALLTANNVETGATSVTFSIDMSPALQHTTPFLPASDSVFLFVDTPFFALTNGITVPGDNGENFITTSDSERERLRFTDDDGDMVYELTLDLMLPTLNHIGFRIAYGEPTSADGSLVANGGGFDAGRRHYQYIAPQVDSELNVTWASSYSFPQLTWKASDLPFEQPPSYTTVGNEDNLANVETFRLNQNYPNPFNPSTTISFNLPNAADVTLSVYNVLGQRVATLLNSRKYTSGSHTLSFDASNLASGIYIYRIQAGSYTSQKRMTLIK
ncbi:MAG: T9SS type A sorting domain-containing protein [Balneola sp.]